MKTFFSAALVLLLAGSTCCLAKRASGGDGDDSGPQTLVTGVTPGSAAGTGVIAISGGTPFTVTANATIILDGKQITLADVHSGLQVISQTVEGNSAPEIDLKTPEAAPSSPKKNKKNKSQNQDQDQ